MIQLVGALSADVHRISESLRIFGKSKPDDLFPSPSEVGSQGHRNLILLKLPPNLRLPTNLSPLPAGEG